MDCLCKDVLNIIGEFVNGDKKYWKRQFGKVINNLTISIEVFKRVVHNRVRIKYGYFTMWDFKFENTVKHFIHFLKINRYWPPFRCYRDIFDKPHVFNKCKYDINSVIQYENKMKLQTNNIIGKYEENLEKLKKLKKVKIKKSKKSILKCLFKLFVCV
jgi:hypothetical protein